MTSEEKKILESFLGKVNMPGVCGFFIPEDTDSVMIIMDLNWLKNVQANPNHIGIGMRKRLKDKIEKYLGLNVYVGSTTIGSCSENN